MNDGSPRVARDDLPVRMRGLPLDHRGFPVPWFVAWVRPGGALANVGDAGAEPDFRVVDTRKMIKAVRQRRCWLCGQPLGRYLAFVIGPMCAVNRINSEPPSHRECAEFAMRACPFLSRPRMRRNEVDLPGGMKAAAGVHLDHNPGVMCLWIGTGYEPVRAAFGKDGVLFCLGDPVETAWFTEGRPATREEIEEALAKGLPQLREIAEHEGGDSPEVLDQQLARFRATVLA